MKPPYVLFVPASAAKALKAETMLRAAGIEAVLMAIPRSVSSDCGVCLRVSLAERKQAEMVLAEAGVVVSAVYEIDDRLGEMDRNRAEE